MTANNPTPENYTAPEPNDNNSLNLQWTYFKSRHGLLLVACFGFAPFVHDSNFTRIDRDTYNTLLQEQQNK